jgi:hypothetical protein
MGWFENWNRFYDPVSGRYTAPDPELPSVDRPTGLLLCLGWIASAATRVLVPKKRGPLHRDRCR